MKHRLNEMEEWRSQCRQQLKRGLKERLDYGFVYTYKPVLDDAKARVFNSMKEYREWCHNNLPAYLGYKIYGGTKTI
ncbi:MAG: hypothetical protein AB1297_04740 [bacterium]